MVAEERRMRMLLRQERLALGLLCAVTAVIILTSVFLNSADRANFAEPYHDKVPDGALVEISGEVGELSRTGTGGHLVARVEGVLVFIPSDTAGKISVRKGDRVRIIGIAQTYRGEKEIVVQSPSDIIPLTSSEVLTSEKATRS